MEQLRLIKELEEKDKNIIFSMLDTMLTKKKFNDFFAENVATLYNKKTGNYACFFITFT